MTTENVRNLVRLAGDVDDYARAVAAEGAEKELRAIEKACIDLYLHGSSGMSDESCTVLQNVGAFAHGEEPK